MELRQELNTNELHVHHTVSHLTSAQFDLHCHNYYEIYYLIAGEVHYRIEGEAFAPQADSVLLIPPNAFHGVRIDSAKAYERYAIHFVPELVAPEFRRTLLAPFRTAGFYLNDLRDSRLQSFCSALIDCAQMDGTIRQIAVQSRLEALLSELYCISQQKTILPDERHEQIAQIIAYLNEHLAEPLALDGISAKFFVSKNHLNVLFRQATGTTLSNYIAYKRAALAQQLLAEGSSATDAAEHAGFQDYSTFFRTYKKVFGHSPAQFKETRWLTPAGIGLG